MHACASLLTQAAQWPYFEAHRVYSRCTTLYTASPAQTNACLANAFITDKTHYNYLLEWVAHPNAGSGPGSKAFSFSGAFLRAWGSRYAPDIAAGQSLRWLTSQFVHADLNHLLSNTLLFIFLCLCMEVKYGTLRIAIIWAISILGAGFFSAAIESPCVQVRVWARVPSATTTQRGGAGRRQRRGPFHSMGLLPPAHAPPLRHATCPCHTTPCTCA